MSSTFVFVVQLEQNYIKIHPIKDVPNLREVS